MSYMEDQCRVSASEWRDGTSENERLEMEPEEIFRAGFLAGFQETLIAYGIWKDGVQTIGCREVPVSEELRKQFPHDFGSGGT